MFSILINTIIKGDEMAKACNTHMRYEKCINILAQREKARCHLGNLGIHENITLEYILNK